MVLFLIRYNELGLKSPRVRSRFQKQLIKNIEDKFLRLGLDCFIESDWGRIYLNTDDEAQGFKILKTVFGIASVSTVISSTDKINEIIDATISYSKSKDLLKSGQSFALRTRRTGQHKYTSMDLAKQVGKAVLDRLNDLNLNVKLTKPDVQIFIEVRNRQSYIFSEAVPGPGGLPLSTQGKVISIFSDKDSYIATWLMMKRGCRAYPVYFKPTIKNSNNKEQIEIESQIELLRSWTPNLKLKIIELDGPDKNNNNDNNLNFQAVYLENEEFKNYSKWIKAKGICMSSDFKGFSLLGRELNDSLPIFYPLIGLDEKHFQKLEHLINDVR